MSNFYNNNKRTAINTFDRIKRKPFQFLTGLLILFFFLYLFGFFSTNKHPNGPQVRPIPPKPTNSTFHIETFAYKANADLKKYDISIITQFTTDRFDRIAIMADKWRAPISAAVYIRSYKDIDEVFKLVRSSYAVSEFVDLHFLFTNHTKYPVNNLRNLALRNSRTEWNLLLDVDFVSPLGMYDYLHSILEKIDNDKRVNERRIHDLFINNNDGIVNNNNNNNEDGEENKISFVIPSFSSSLSHYNFPDNKKELIDFINAGDIKEINSGVCPKCHGPTNYKRWYSASEPYTAEYKWIYEPFLLFNRSQIDDYDERLKGYGFDKNSHTFGMAAAGFQFVVLPNAWIIHMNHQSKPWEGADTFDEQMYDNLEIVCNSILPDSKLKNGYDPNIKLFNEPLKDNDKCITNEHW